MPQNLRRTTRDHSVQLASVRDAQVRREALETIVRAFTNPGFMERHMTAALWRGALFDPEHTRVTITDGRVVSVVTMAPRMIRFGPVTVPAMTVGPVGTHDHYRKRGYGAAAMADASAYMRANGFLLAYLQGIPDFYHRFGYYPYMAPSCMKLPREDIRKQGLPGRLRTMRKADLPAVRQLHSRAIARRCCAAERDPDLWEWLFARRRATWLFPNPRVILDAEHRLVGYLTMQAGDKLRVKELFLRAGETNCRVALGAVAREARRRELKEIVLELPWDDPVAVWARRSVPAEFTLSSNPTGGALMAVLDPHALMRRLQPLFTLRWRDAKSSLPGTTFTLATDGIATTFAVATDGVTIVDRPAGPTIRIPAPWLAGLISGYHGAAELRGRRQIAIPAAVRPHLNILFPQGWPYVYQGDNY